MKTYANANQDLRQRGQQIIEAHHPELHEAGILIDFIWAISNGGPAITVNGYPAAGCCKVVSLKDRAMGRGDIEIQIDKRKWESTGEKTQDALLDHEITHIEPITDVIGAQELDAIGRPRFCLRKHDYQFGWFTEIAERYGDASYEVAQATQLLNRDGQQYFPGFLPAQAPKMTIVKPPKKRNAA